MEPLRKEGRSDADGTLEEAERLHILTTLKKTRWVLSGPRGAARHRASVDLPRVRV
jgi:hypothetical protein